MKRWIATLMLVALAVFGVARSALAVTSSGAAVVVDANQQPLLHGSTSTTFTLQLPKGAECQGDSQDGNYRVQSFFVPRRLDPGALTYHLDAPDGEGNQPLWDVFTNPYTQGLTGVAKDKGGPGPIANTPMFSFAVYTPRLDLIPTGTYRTGLACTLHNKTTRYWMTEMRVVTDAAQPTARQISWRVLRPQTKADRGATAGWLVALLVVGLAGVGLAVSRARRSRS